MGFALHKKFLALCVTEELVLKRLEETIDDCDQEFVNNWYKKNNFRYCL